MAELLKDTVLLRKDYFTPTQKQEVNHGTVTGELALKGKVVAIFFSGAWCPPCQHFVPVLKEMHEELMQRQSEFEIVFVSMDKNEDEMVDYYKEKHGNWLALKYGDPMKEVLAEKYKISIIPKLVIVGPDGEVISSKGRKDTQDKGLISFKGWHSSMMAAAKKADQKNLLLEQLEAEGEQGDTIKESNLS